MTNRSHLMTSPPYGVERALKALGSNLRTARLRRNIPVTELAERIGVGRRVVSDAERGKPSTGVAVYVALLWALGLSAQLEELADPARDEEGRVLAGERERSRAGRKAR
jgi:transcriptional regulator with XRE-family HTH domain